MVKVKGTPLVIVEKLKNLIPDKIYVVSITEHKEKRTLNQNAYYWTLLDQFADYERQNKIKLHNEMIARYGQRHDGLFALIDSEQDVYGTAGVHLRPTAKTIVGKDNKTYTYCQIMKGSSLYNTKEMSILIDGLISEIKGSEAPIETLDEAQMREMWG